MDKIKSSILAELQSLENDYTEKIKKILQVTSEVSVDKQKQQIAQEQLNSVKKENTKLLELLNKNQQETHRVFQLEQANSELNSNLQKLQTELHDKKAEIEKLQNEKEVITKNYELALSDEKQQHEEVLLMTRTDHKKVVQELNESIEKLHENVKKLEKEVENLRESNNTKEAEKTELIMAQQRILTEKNQEITQLRKELSEKEQQFLEREQKARMKYEENLLQVTKLSGAGSPYSETLVDVYRKKIFSQKQEYQKEIDNLKRKLAVYEEQNKKKQKS